MLVLVALMVGSLAASSEARGTSEHRFETPPLVRLAAAGDVGTGGRAARTTADVIDAQERHGEYDALVVLGDNVYPNGDPAQVERTVRGPFAGVLDNDTALLAVLGNHDVRDANADAHARAIGMPARWYSTRLGDVLVVSLDSTQPDNPAQLAWLDSTLAVNDATWTIATMHHPPYSYGHHGSSLDVRASFSPLFERHGVDLVLAGHDHDYQRLSSINDVTYVVTGGAAKLRPTGAGEHTALARSIFHFVDIAIWEDSISLAAVDHDGHRFDEVTLNR